MCRKWSACISPIQCLSTLSVWAHKLDCLFFLRLQTSIFPRQPPLAYWPQSRKLLGVRPRRLFFSNFVLFVFRCKIIILFSHWNRHSFLFICFFFHRLLCGFLSGNMIFVGFVLFKHFIYYYIYNFVSLSFLKLDNLTPLSNEPISFLFILFLICVYVYIHTSVLCLNIYITHILAAKMA